MGARKTAWVVVVVVALGLSNWSIAYVAHQWQVPWALAYTVSAVFDGVALLMADLALKAARLGDSTFAPSAFLFLFGGASAYFNAWHARLAGLPLAASVFYAFPPLAALVAVELELRHDRRQALRDKGRIAEPLPAFGGITWLLKPWAAYRAIRAIVKHRLTGKLTEATGVKAPRTVDAVRSPAGQPEGKQAVMVRGPGSPRARVTAVQRGALVAKLLADRGDGLPITINTVADRHGVTRWTSAQAIKALNGSAR